MRYIATALLTIILLFTADTTCAQNRVGMQIFIDVITATQDTGDAELNRGIRFETNVTYGFMRDLSAYAGWGRQRFGADGPFAGAEANFEKTGYQFGLQFTPPLPSTPVDYYIGAGGIYNRIEVENGAMATSWIPDTGLAGRRARASRSPWSELASDAGAALPVVEPTVLHSPVDLAIAKMRRRAPMSVFRINCHDGQHSSIAVPRVHRYSMTCQCAVIDVISWKCCVMRLGLRPNPPTLPAGTSPRRTD